VTSGYGDIRAVSNLEKAFEVFVILVCRSYIAFLAAEVTKLSQEFRASDIDHIAKVRVRRLMNLWSQIHKIKG